MPRKVDLKGRSIAELTEALEYVIDQHIQNLKFYREMLDSGEDIKIAKAYRDMRTTVNQLRPVQYIVEKQVPAMVEIFKQFEGK